MSRVRTKEYIDINLSRDENKRLNKGYTIHRPMPDGKMIAIAIRRNMELRKIKRLESELRDLKKKSKVTQ